jgi:hypothetical protein
MQHAEITPVSAFMSLLLCSFLYLFFIFLFFYVPFPSARRLFESFRNPDNIRNVLRQVYVNEAAVDNELVDIIYRCACGQIDVFHKKKE